MKTFKIVLTLEVADDIEERYPNFSLNYDSIEEFARVMGEDYEIENMDHFGYRLTSEVMDSHWLLTATSLAPKVWVEVTNGVAEITSEGDVEVELIDNDVEEAHG